jgi:hypothetical protein
MKTNPVRRRPMPSRSSGTPVVVPFVPPVSRETDAGGAIVDDTVARQLRELLVDLSTAARRGAPRRA